MRGRTIFMGRRPIFMRRGGIFMGRRPVFMGRGAVFMGGRTIFRRRPIFMRLNGHGQLQPVLAGLQVSTCEISDPFFLQAYRVRVHFDWVCEIT
jgi:hypothetical protein